MLEQRNLLREALKLRDEYLTTKLRLLGYESVEDIDRLPDDSAGYRVLGRIGHDLEHFVDPVEKILKPDEQSKLAVESLRQEIADDILFMENQNEFLAKVRSIFEDFGTNMQSKVSAEDWEIYSKVVQKTARLLRVLTIGDKSRRLVPSKIEREDMISELIDSEDFSIACRIEDAFVLDELDIFKELAETYGYEDENIKDTTCAASLAELVRESEITYYKKEKYVDSYEKYQKFLDSLTDRVIIKGGTADKRYDERG